VKVVAAQMLFDEEERKEKSRKSFADACEDKGFGSGPR
jgi:hypothetical protein